MTRRDSPPRLAVRDVRPKSISDPAPLAASEVPPEEDRRLLRVSLCAAVLVHAGLLLLPMPWSGVAAEPEPPPEVVHTLVNVRPVPPEPPPTEMRPETPPVSVEPIPVPEWAVVEPAVDEPAVPLPKVELPAEVPVILLDPPPPPPVPAPKEEDSPIHVIGAVEPPVAIHAPHPAFPEIARRVGRDGIVVVQVVIDREGRVGEVEVLRPAPFGMTEAAVEAVKRWRFRPAELDGRPVAVFYHLTVRFTIR